jgi:CO dehydrogenase maturation factor
LLGELERNGRIVVADFEAGLGTTLRLQPGTVDVALVVAEPTPKSLEVARRAVEAARERARVVVVANKVRDDADADAVRTALPDSDVVVVPEDTAVARADREGVAPLDLDGDAPAVRALVALADRLAG